MEKCIPKKHSISYVVKRKEEKKKNVCKMKHHKDVVYKENTKKVCKMNFNCQKDSS